MVFFASVCLFSLRHSLRSPGSASVRPGPDIVSLRRRSLKRASAWGVTDPTTSLPGHPPSFVASSGEKINPHTYVPHTSKEAKTIPECTNCHTPHGTPPKAEKLPSCPSRMSSGVTLPVTTRTTSSLARIATGRQGGLSHEGRYRLRQRARFIGRERAERGGHERMEEKRPRHMTLNRFLVQRQQTLSGGCGRTHKGYGPTRYRGQDHLDYMRRIALEGLNGLTGGLNVQGEKVGSSTS